MTGLDLESFMVLLRADLGVWLMLGLATLGLGFLVWSSWSSRRALRNCLVLSLAAHLAVVVFGTAFPGIVWRLSPSHRFPRERSHIREIRVATLVDATSRRAPDSIPTSGIIQQKPLRPATAEAPGWDRLDTPLALEDKPLRVARTSDVTQLESLVKPNLAETAVVSPVAAVPKAAPLVSEARPPEPRPAPDLKAPATAPAAVAPVPVDAKEIDGDRDEVAAGAADARSPAGEESTGAAARGPLTALRFEGRLRPGRSGPASVISGSSPLAKTSGAAGSGGSAKRGASEVADKGSALETFVLEGGARPAGAIPSVSATPKPRVAPTGAIALEALGARPGRQDPVEIPKIYQPRLEPDRFAMAQRIGASAASERAVERAIEWLTRHQDQDGRWNAAIARYADGTAVKGDRDFTQHCPPGETCFGECAYWEADTALTGLALLTYLGAGYTHVEGRYADNVGRGLDFLKGEQKRDGDLRGRSKVVGMYCHSMATLALCEAYALTGDARLRGPVERAIAFMVSARAADGMAWRYAPGAPVGDTSILGWVVMGLKSAKEIGIAIPDENSVRRGTLLWLEKVATGDAKGLARYQPSEPVTATMTAEAWVCRQFLGVGGPGAASSEAADFLQAHESDRGPTNMYYWYYATLALYQHGGEPWSRWNDRLRDKIVGLQCGTGHQTGSWEPDSSLYGSKGGRIYCTALAALTLEVYYRYLRLYDEPNVPLEAKDDGGSGKARG
jgi:hypothetical protein